MHRAPSSLNGGPILYHGGGGTVLRRGVACGAEMQSFPLPPFLPVFGQPQTASDWHSRSIGEPLLVIGIWNSARPGSGEQSAFLRRSGFSNERRPFQEQNFSGQPRDCTDDLFSFGSALTS